MKKDYYEKELYFFDLVSDYKRPKSEIANIVLNINKDIVKVQNDINYATDSDDINYLQKVLIGMMNRQRLLLFKLTNF